MYVYMYTHIHRSCTNTTSSSTTKTCCMDGKIFYMYMCTQYSLSLLHKSSGSTSKHNLNDAAAAETAARPATSPTMTTTTPATARTTMTTDDDHYYDYDYGDYYEYFSIAKEYIEILLLGQSVVPGSLSLKTNPRPLERSLRCPIAPQAEAAQRAHQGPGRRGVRSLACFRLWLCLRATALGSEMAASGNSKV